MHGWRLALLTEGMSEFYEIDSRRVSYREYWWGTKSPLVLIGWLLKWLRIRIPGSTDDPNVDSTLLFVVEALPPDIAASFEPVTAELGSLGFLEPAYQVIHDTGTRTTIYWAMFRHVSGKHFARIHRRVWTQAPKASRKLFPVFLTGFADGTFLVSSAGKPDLATPDTVQMNRMHGAKTAELWAAHERLAESASERKMIAPVLSREELLAASERHHVLLRDFNLGRGVFRRRSTAEHAKAEAFAASIAKARACGEEHAEVLAELDRLQEEKPGWRATVWILALSLIVFLAAGAAKWDWKFTLWIIPVLFFHELGHWTAMRLFRYRNLRMFFIPLFGAAVTGRNWNVLGWKKALVSLAGPLPGIGVGVLFGMAGLVLKHAWLTNAALALLFVNGLNLLPILPLDGGHALQHTLFCRNRWLDGAFRSVAIVCLILFGILIGAKLLPLLAIPMALSLPLVFKLGKVTDDLRRRPLPPPLPGEDRIPASTAQAIVQAVREALPAKPAMTNKMLAQHTVSVFERLNAKPPGALATLSLLALHGGAFFAAVLVGLVLVVSKHSGGLGDFMTAAARQPQHAFERGDIQRWPERGRQNETSSRTLVVTTFENRAAARSAFAELTNRAPVVGALMRFGDSLLVSLPAGDEASRERWFDDLQARATNTFVALSNSPVAVSLVCIAPTDVAATNLIRELGDYFDTAGQMQLIPPWSAEASRADFAARRRAREEWSSIGQEVAKAWREPSVQSYNARISAALKRGARAEASRLAEEQTQKLQEIQNQTRERLGASRGVDLALLELHAKLSGLGMTNRANCRAVWREIAGKLGEVPYVGDAPAPGANACGVTTGTVIPHGLLIEMRWISFRDLTEGLPGMTEWLWGLGCRQFKYELEGSSGWGGEFDGLEDLTDSEM